MRSIYKNVIFLGGSELILNCMKKFFETDRNGIQVIFLDVEKEDSVKKQKLCEEFGVLHYMVKRKSLTEYLVHVSENSLVFSIMNNYILPEEVVTNENLRIVNLHHSTLPGHRGMNAGAWAIFYNDEYSGITWHIVSEEVDKGQIIKITPIKVTEDMTAVKLLRQQNIAAVNDFGELQEILLRGQEKVYEQPEGEDYLHKLHDVPGDGHIDSSWNGAKISAFLRAMDFGVLNIFGKPDITFEGITYQWKKYQIKREENVQEEIRMDEKDGKKEIVIAKPDGYVIRLMKIIAK